MQKQKGFTLIELLVVIAIIGILSSVVMASLNSAREKARDAKRIADLQQMQLALEMYYDDNSGYPLTAAFTAANMADYLPAIPTDPLDVAYVYTAAAATDYCLSATIEGTNIPDNDADCLAGPQIYSVAP